VLTLTRKQLEGQADEHRVPKRNPGFFLDYTVVTTASDGEVEDQNARQERKKQIAKVGSMWNLSQSFRHFPERMRIVALAVAVTVVAAWVPNTAAADSERGSAVDQYLEQVPSAEGNKSSDDNNSAGGNASGSQGSKTPSAGGSNGSSNSGSGDAKAKAKATKKAKAKADKKRKDQAKDAATQDNAAKEGDSQDKQNVTPVPASSSDGGGGDGGGAPVGLVLVLVVLSLIASAAFVLRRRAGGGRSTSARGSQQPS
jgi:hypothetical protein